VTQAPSETSPTTSDVRDILAAHIGGQVDVQSLQEDQDLYSAGLTSLSTVGLMLALEDRFDVEFPDSMLGRATFRSIASIVEAIGKLAP
jgi:acyl carrier protein